MYYYILDRLTVLEAFYLLTSSNLVTGCGAGQPAVLPFLPCYAEAAASESLSLPDGYSPAVIIASNSLYS